MIAPFSGEAQRVSRPNGAVVNSQGWSAAEPLEISTY